MVNQKPILFPETIEAVVDCWAQHLVDDMGKGWKVADYHTGQLFEVGKKIATE